MTMALTADSYSFLDKQLADLLLRLCSNDGHTLSPEQKTQLTTLARHTSAATRNGIIALPLAEIADGSEDFPYTPDNMKALLDLPVVGSAGDYAPLIIEDDHVWLNRYWQYENRLAHSL
ncbi:MAG: RecBCD enzyme subunit RecD, partial [uncultured Thiotrichaceae bacterium]